MANALNLLVRIGPGVLLLGLCVSLALAALGCARCSGGRLRWLGRYVLQAAVVGIAALLAGAALGIALFCATGKAGNLCGLGGVLGTGPLAAGIALAAHACRRVLGAGFQ